MKRRDFTVYPFFWFIFRVGLWHENVFLCIEGCVAGSWVLMEFFLVERMIWSKMSIFLVHNGPFPYNSG